MSYTFSAGNLVLVKAPRNNKLGVACYKLKEFVRYLTHSHFLAEVLRSDGKTIELSVIQLRPYQSTRSQRLDRYPPRAIAHDVVGDSPDSFSMSVSLSLGIGENDVEVSGPADIPQGIGMAGLLHRPIETVKKRLRQSHDM